MESLDEGRQERLADRGFETIRATAGHEAEFLGEIPGGLDERSDGRAFGVVGVAVEEAGLRVAAGPAGDRETAAAAVERRGVVDVDETGVLGDVPDVGGLEEVVVVGLRALVAEVEAGDDAGFFEGEDHVGAVFREIGRINDLGVVVGAEGVALGVAEERGVLNGDVGRDLDRLDGLGVVFAAEGVVTRFQEAQVTVDLHGGAPRDGVAAAEDR